jgi:hypothetical protein
MACDESIMAVLRSASMQVLVDFEQTKEPNDLLQLMKSLEQVFPVYGRAIRSNLAKKKESRINGCLTWLLGLLLGERRLVQLLLVLFRIEFQPHLPMTGEKLVFISRRFCTYFV